MGSAEVVDEVVGLGVGVEVAEVVGSGSGTGLMMIVGLEEVVLLKTVEVVVVGAAIMVWAFFEDGVVLGVSFGGVEGAALLVIGS